MPKNQQNSKKIENFTHKDASRRNIPSAEYQTMVQNQEKTPLEVEYQRRNPDLDPQLIWRGKSLLDGSPLVVNAPPLYIQEKIHPRYLIDSLKAREREENSLQNTQTDLFKSFNGLSSEEAKTEFYKHDQNWSNRMILGDSLQVMASLSEREGLREKIQCIYFDPPYGIKFNSNFQWSTTTRNVKDGKLNQITREPEQVKAFRDTWKDKTNSYLNYFRDRLIAAKELLTESGSIFVQIGEENLHRLRIVMDEVMGEENFFAQISFIKAGALGASGLPRRLDYILWYAKNVETIKFRKGLIKKDLKDLGQYKNYINNDYSLRPLTKEEKLSPSLIDPTKICRLVSFTKPGPGSKYDLNFEGKDFKPGKRWWGFPEESTNRIIKSGRIKKQGQSIASLRYWNDYPAEQISNIWTDTASGSGMDKVYVVQTNEKVIQRCMLMSTDPGDLVLDPTCGSGTSAFVAEQWGRRWITIDTSRVALALARARLMGARYPYYLLTDSHAGKQKEAFLNKSLVSKNEIVNNNLRQGFVYERVPHITLKAISNNDEIDSIWDKYSSRLEKIKSDLNIQIKANFKDWEIPYKSDSNWSQEIKNLHSKWWELKIDRQKEIDKSIESKTDFEYLYDRPYEDSTKIRISGPFTIESLCPHRTMIVNDDDSLIDPQSLETTSEETTDFAHMIIETLRVAGVQQANKQDKIAFNSLTGWPGNYISGKGNYCDSNGDNKIAGIFIGPEFGTVSRVDLVEAARECADIGFDVLISCAFNYEGQTTDFNKLGGLPILQARMNADLHMQQDLKNTGKGNMFVIFGEPDIDIIDINDDQIQVKINGVDVFDPSTSEVRSDDPGNIACWFIDSEYNGESFFVRQAYFLGQNDPYKQLKNSLKAEIDNDAWSSLNSEKSISFSKPSTGRIAVKVINHLGDEVMKVYRVE